MFEMNKQKYQCKTTTIWMRLSVWRMTKAEHTSEQYTFIAAMGFACNRVHLMHFRFFFNCTISICLQSWFCIARWAYFNSLSALFIEFFRIDRCHSFIPNTESFFYYYALFSDDCWMMVPHAKSYHSFARSERTPMNQISGNLHCASSIPSIAIDPQFLFALFKYSIECNFIKLSFFFICPMLIFMNWKNNIIWDESSIQYTYMCVVCAIFNGVEWGNFTQ